MREGRSCCAPQPTTRDTEADPLDTLVAFYSDASAGFRSGFQLLSDGVDPILDYFINEEFQFSAMTEPFAPDVKIGKGPMNQGFILVGTRRDTDGVKLIGRSSLKERKPLFRVLGNPDLYRASVSSLHGDEVYRRDHAAFPCWAVARCSAIHSRVTPSMPLPLLAETTLAQCSGAIFFRRRI